MSQPQASFRIGWSSHDLFNAVFHSVPKILVFLLLLTIGWFAASALIVVVALGVSAALDQAGVTAAVREPVLYTMVLTCGAILAIGVGGGLVKPMQARWERMLAAAETETGNKHAAESHGRSAVEEPGPTQRQGQHPGPRCLQSFSFSQGPGDLGYPGYQRSFGRPPADQGAARATVRQEDPCLPAEDGFQDDPDNYPGGQYM